MQKICLLTKQVITGWDASTIFFFLLQKYIGSVNHHLDVISLKVLTIRRYISDAWFVTDSKVQSSNVCKIPDWAVSDQRKAEFEKDLC